MSKIHNPEQLRSKQDIVLVHIPPDPAVNNDTLPLQKSTSREKLVDTSSASRAEDQIRWYIVKYTLPFTALLIVISLLIYPMTGSIIALVTVLGTETIIGIAIKSIFTYYFQRK